MTDRELEELSASAGDLAMVRPMDEWRPKGVGEPGQLAAFLDQAEELFAWERSRPHDLQETGPSAPP